MTTGVFVGMFVWCLEVWMFCLVWMFGCLDIDWILIGELIKE